MKNNKYFSIIVLLIVSCQSTYAWEWSTPAGHVKYQFDGAHYPRNSVYSNLIGSSSRTHLLDNRWKFSANHLSWDLKVDYQLQGVHGDRQLLAGIYGNSTSSAIDDDSRWFDLTHTLSDDENDLVLHRLDRLNIGHTTEHTVLRFGRQVVSWGNGLFFNPMDFFNPFDPTALDKEYKSGDDMLYGQYLFNSGADLQGVWVVRRDPVDGDVHRDNSSKAFKYHTWINESELDLLVANHFDDDMLGAGLVKSIGGTVWRGDVVVTRSELDTYTSLVTNLSYSWVWGKTNYSGVLEYFYNGFGLKGDYNLLDVSTEPDLWQRLVRGELYTTGKHYLAASASIELTPLLVATPTLFMNLSDQSAYLQLGSQYSLAQNWQLTAAVNLPIGKEGTEYGGLESGVLNNTLATDWGLFLQLGFYY